MDSIYCTAFNILSSFYDVKIEFATIEPLTDKDGNVIDSERTPQQRVTLPIALAKELAKKLSESVSQYEASFGEVRLFPADDSGKQGADG